MPGCAAWFGVEPILENELVNHYRQFALQEAQLDPTIQSPVPTPSLGPGRELTPPDPQKRWNLSLAEAIQMGLGNNSIIRQNAQFMASSNPLMRSPDNTPSIYDAQIQNAGVLFGSRGIDAALSDFDPRFTTTFKSGQDVTIDNTTDLPPPHNLLNQNYSQLQSKFEQQLLTGGLVSVTQNWNYGLSNLPDQLFNSAYTGALGAEFRQPLWQGSGKEFTSIAGPSSQRARGFSLVSQGIVIAHINKRMSEIDFQEHVQNFLREIGDVYWDLYQNYQDYEAEHQNTLVAMELWQRMSSRQDIDPGADVAQSEDAYYESKAREEQSLSNLFITEGKLRRLIGLSIDDPRLIYPSDQPREDEIPLNRPMCLYEALVNRIELTRQKTNLHSLELQLKAARNLVNPKLDFVSGYALNGFGNNFMGPPSVGAPIVGTGASSGVYNNAVANLFSGHENSWSVGFEYSIPLWLRQEKSQVRQLELRIVKARATLAVQEDEISHELNTVLMTIKRAHSVARINRRRLNAAERRVAATQAEYEAGTKSNDLLLRALNSRTQARTAYVRSITEYNKSLRDLLFRTGLLMTADGVSVLGVDGLPLTPPPSPESPLQSPPKPDDDRVPPEPEPNTPDDKSPPSPSRPRKVASEDGTILSDAFPIIIRGDAQSPSADAPSDSQPSRSKKPPRRPAQSNSWDGADNGNIIPASDQLPRRETSE